MDKSFLRLKQVYTPQNMQMECHGRRRATLATENEEEEKLGTASVIRDLAGSFYWRTGRESHRPQENRRHKARSSKRGRSPTD